MKKKGFTLIELLAVIVILAIIALIATPIILNIINDSKEESNKRSVELYGKAVEQAIAKSQLNGTEILAGDLSSTFLETVQYSGSEVTCTTNKLYEDGSIYLAGCRVGTDTKEYTYGKQMVVKLCTANTTSAQAYVHKSGDVDQISSYKLENVGLIKTSESDAYTAGVAYTCNFIDDNESNNITFFVLSESGDSVTLISGSNLGEVVAWLSYKDYLAAGGPDLSNEYTCQNFGICMDNTYGPITAMKYLQEITSNWTKLTTEQKATIKLPTKAQIEGAYTGSMPKWLYSHTTDNVTYCYWTASLYYDGSNNAWNVCFDGSFGAGGFDSTGYYGVRPVITLSKSSIN